MQTTTPRDILSNDDIAATCGDADCATSDAEMTPALTLAEIVALPAGTKLVRLDDGGGLYVKFSGASCYAVNADGSYVKGGRKIAWKAGRFGRAS